MNDSAADDTISIRLLPYLMRILYAKQETAAATSDFALNKLLLLTSASPRTEMLITRYDVKATCAKDPLPLLIDELYSNLRVSSCQAFGIKSAIA